VGFTAAVLYTLVNALNKGLLFLSTGVRGRLVAAAFVIGALSVAGVPPAVGFLGKLELFRTAVTDGGVVLVVLLLLGSALSLLYMFQTYQRTFWRGSRAGTATALPGRLIVAALGIVVLGLGLWPEPLLALSQRAADVLTGGHA
jgi:multicomponent Na+:H+ antiporter subunit D